MKKIFILTILFIVTLHSYSQTITYKDLLFIINSEETEKIDDFLSKKGFEIGEVSNSNGCGSFTWGYKNNELKLSQVQQIVKLCDENNNINVSYGSSNPTNYEIVRKEIIKMGYKKLGENTHANMLNFGYEKGKYRIVFSKKKGEKYDGVNNKTILYIIMILTQRQDT
jgi:hypothetical protein